MFKKGNIIITYRFNSKYNNHFDYISIEKIFNEENEIFAHFYRIDLTYYEYSWFYEKFPLNDDEIKIISLDEFKRNMPEELKSYKKEIKKLFKEFNLKYIVDLRKIKLRKLIYEI